MERGNLKVILSRKGFDSRYGGCPSPILPDGTLLSLPIPGKNEAVKFSDLSYRDKSLFQIITELKPRTKIKEKYTCHLDPDIRNYGVQPSWKALFGQEGGALTHLENYQVSIHALFLFFGWFRQTEEIGGRLRFVKNAPDLHVIFGYLQVGRIYDQFNLLPADYYYHPHGNPERYDAKNNCIYEAADQLDISTKLNGFGTFRYDNSLLLTKKGLSRSKWDLPDFFRDMAISRHNKHSFKDGYFDSAKIGQEFIIEPNDQVTQWALKCIQRGLL